PAGSMAKLDANSAVLFPTGTPANLQNPTAVVLAPDVAGSYTLQATVNYGSGLGVAVGSASVTVVHSMDFSVFATSADGGAIGIGFDVPPPDGGSIFSPSTYVRTWLAIRADSPIASAEAFLDGQSLGRLTQPNLTVFYPGLHGIPGPISLTYGLFIPKTQLVGPHTLRWVVTGETGSGIVGDGTISIGETGGPLTSFGPFSGN